MSRNRNQALWGLFVIQVVCTVYFVSDAFGDILGHDTGSYDGAHELPEFIAAFTLLISTVFTGLELRRATAREARMRDQLAIASGEFAALLERYFDDWSLTDAERAVATLAIKGFSITEIAAMRATKEGTIKAQNAAIYRKAGVSGRLQMLSLFIDDLMDGGVVSAGA